VQLEELLKQTPTEYEAIKTDLIALHEANQLSSEDYFTLLAKIDELTIKISKPPSASSDNSANSAYSGNQSDELSRNSQSFWQNQWQDSEELVLEPGMIIRENYRLEEKVGEGGMGVVWKATDLLQEAGKSPYSYVAIKFLSQNFKQHPDALKTVVREFSRYKRLSHPNIVQAYELNRTGRTVFIVMEFLKGIPLDQLIKNNPNGIPLEQAKPIIRAMAQALGYAHQEGIAHLDFKPNNVLYEHEQKSVKVIDFGIARLLKESDRQKTQFDPGKLGAYTQSYTSYEILLGLEPDQRTDIYALACVTYELLSGKHPFDKKAATQAENENLSPKPIKGLNRRQYQALLQALVFKRADRTSKVDEFLAAFFPEAKAIQDQEGALK